MIIIVFILGGDESVKHRTSAHSEDGNWTPQLCLKGSPGFGTWLI